MQTEMAMNGWIKQAQRRESLGLLCSESQCRASQVGMGHFASAVTFIYHRTTKHHEMGEYDSPVVF